MNNTAHTTERPALLEVRNLYREFPSGDDVVTVLNNINLQIAAGEMVAIIGQSGNDSLCRIHVLLISPCTDIFHFYRLIISNLFP